MSVTNQQNEHLSGLMDDEPADFSSAATLDKLCKDADLKGCWQRYHLIGDIMRERNIPSLSGDFSQRVMSALENEPTILAPPVSRPASQPSLPQRFLKPVAGLAIAASVAAVTVFSMQNILTTDTPNPHNLASLATTSQSSPLNKPFASQPTVSAAGLLPASASAPVESGEESLNSYILRHMESSPTGNMQGGLSYVKLAGFDEKQ